MVGSLAVSQSVKEGTVVQHMIGTGQNHINVGRALCLQAAAEASVPASTPSRDAVERPLSADNRLLYIVLCNSIV